MKINTIYSAIQGEINVSGIVENIKNEKLNPNIRENLLTINEFRFINSKERQNVFTKKAPHNDSIITTASFGLRHIPLIKSIIGCVNNKKRG